MIFLTLGHAANTGAGQTHTSLETVGFARMWEKRAKYAAARSSEVLQEEEAVVSEHIWNLPSASESEAVQVL